MNRIDQNQTITLFNTYEAAARIAEANQADDPEWAYTVEEYPRGFVVVVYDEGGEKLGTL